MKKAAKELAEEIRQMDIPIGEIMTVVAFQVRAKIQSVNAREAFYVTVLTYLAKGEI